MIITRLLLNDCLTKTFLLEIINNKICSMILNSRFCAKVA